MSVLRGLADGPRSPWCSPGWVIRGAGAVLAAATAVACSAGTARAEYTHLPLFQLGAIPVEGPHGEHVALPGPLQKMESMTIDSGHLWVAEVLDATQSRVDEFDAATGAFIAQPVHVESATPYGEGYGEGYGTGIAIGHGPGEPAVYVGGRVVGKSVVSVFNEAGTLKKDWAGASTPGGSFGGAVTGVAVDNSTDPLDVGQGDVYVAIASQGIVDVFHPETNGEEHYVGQITGTSPSEPFKSLFRVAVNEATGELVVQDGTATPQVDVFKPSGPGTYEFAHRIGPPPSGAWGDSIWTLAVDGGSGDIYVTEFQNEGPYRIDQFSATGSYIGQIENVELLDPYAIAVDPTSHDLYVRNVVYGPDVVIPDVTTASASDLKPESVTLNGTVSPDGGGNVTCEFEWGTSQSFGKTAPCSGEVPNSEGGGVPVHASLVGLERDTTYYYRLRASNANGANSGEPWQDEQFSTHGLILRDEFVSNVAATSATFGATIDPGETPTSYYFEYGASSEYGQQAPAPPGEAIGSGTADVKVPGVHVQGLLPDAVYHYRVVAVSEIGPGQLETIAGEDRTFTTQAAGGAFALADGRRWELVSPADKLGALIEGAGYGSKHVMQASAAGGAIAYRSSAPTESEPSGGYAQVETVLSTRNAGGWSSRDISQPHDRAPRVSGAVGNEFQIFSEDLSRAAVQPVDSAFTPLSSEASEPTAYLRTDYLNGNVEDRCSSSCYRPLVTAANTPPGTVFGEEPEGVCESNLCGPRFQGASPDLSHVVLSSPVQLTSTPAPAGGPGLYEWSDGSLQLLDLLPKGEEGPAVLAGTGPNAAGEPPLGVRGSVSNDGERVVLEGGVAGSSFGGKGLYLRDVPAGETIRLDVPQGGDGPSEDVSYMDASGDASRIFFLDSGPLMADSSSSGADLYEYNLNAPAGSRLSDLSADPNAGQAADVAMMIGASEDGSYVYFAAAGALAPGAVAGGCCDLYVRHEGMTRLVAALPGYEWSKELRGMYARVSPNGQWLAFMSAAELTGYDTRDAASGQPDTEVYLYDAATGRLVCASCDPTGARPAGAAGVPPWTGTERAFGSEAVHQPRYLSGSGRLFFDSADALVPQDVDGVEDVYEYEPQGVGSCSGSSATFAQGSDGCVNLVSAGISPAASTFLDASETGGDVFFMTQAQLAPQDYDTAYDVYDAHECTIAAPCFPVVAQPPPCETEASCKAAPTPQPALYGAPASATFSGTGNLVPAATPATKPRTKSKPKPKPKRRSAKCGRRSTKHGCPKAKKAKSGMHAGAKTAKSRPGGGR